jgi:hypothetical protein
MLAPSANQISSGVFGGLVSAISAKQAARFF